MELNKRAKREKSKKLCSNFLFFTAFCVVFSCVPNKRNQICWKNCYNSLTTWESKSMRVEIWYERRKNNENFFLIVNLKRNMKRIITRIKMEQKLKIKVKVDGCCCWNLSLFLLFRENPKQYKRFHLSVSRNVRRSVCNLHRGAARKRRIRTLQDFVENK